MKKDDCSLTLAGLGKVRKQADLLLRKASAYGRFPTPAKDIISASELEIARENALDKVFLGSLYRRLPNSLKLVPDRIKQAASKVLGLLDRPARTIHLDPELHPKRSLFLSIHEIGHDALPWQRETFDLLEDSESELDSETKDLFEREANCFASEVLFQLDTFAEQSLAFDFGMKAILSLQKQFGTSCYATARRYVASSPRECCLLVFDAARASDGIPILELRRVTFSPSFVIRFGKIQWDNTCGPEHFFVQNRPRNKLTMPRPLFLNDTNGNKVSCLAEAFDSTKQVFFLVYA